MIEAIAGVLVFIFGTFALLQLVGLDGENGCGCAVIILLIPLIVQWLILLIVGQVCLYWYAGFIPNEVIDYIFHFF